MVKRISELNNFPNLNLAKECRILDEWITSRMFIHHIERYYFDGSPCFELYTIEQYINKFHFKKWNLCGSFSNIEDMRSNLKIGTNDLYFAFEIEEDIALLFIQYVLNLYDFCSHIIDTNDDSISNQDDYNYIRRYAVALAKRLNVDIKTDPNTNETYLIERDALSSFVGLEYPHLEYYLLDYKQISHKGNIYRKRQILATLYDSLDLIGKDFQGTSYWDMYKNTHRLINSVARHKKGNDTLIKKFNEMNDNDLEKWCDRSFTYFNACMATYSYLKSKSEFDALLK